VSGSNPRGTASASAAEAEARAKEIEMTTHINGIVQVTRRMNAIEAQMFPLQMAERKELEAEYKSESDLRFKLTLAAIKDGVEPDLIQWAIGMQSPENRALLDDLVAELKGMAERGELVAA